MQLIVSNRAPRASTVLPSVLLGTLVGLVLLGGGLVLAYLTLGTSFLTQFTPAGRATSTQLIAGAIAWSFALTAPALFAIVGLVRLLGVLELVGTTRPKKGRTSRLAASLSDDYVVATRVTLPDGRMVPELVIGPFGAAVIEELPPARSVMSRGIRSWELKAGDGSVRTIENPLERAGRDAERVRSWLSGDDSEYLVKTYAAVVGNDPQTMRSASCAVLTPDEIVTWLSSLPPQASLDEGRRERIVRMVRAAL
jgi:hypothetical protein